MSNENIVLFVLIGLLVFMLYFIKYNKLKQIGGEEDCEYIETEVDCEDKLSLDPLSRYTVFDSKNGDCAGNDLGVTPTLRQNESEVDFLNRCMDTCDDNPNCKGFSFNYDAKKCYLKKVDCSTTPYNRQHNGYKFYYSLSPLNNSYTFEKAIKEKGLKNIVNNHNCQSPMISIPNVFKNRKNFTLYVEFTIDEKLKKNSWNHIIHGGKPIPEPLRTPGIWIRNNLLHIRATATKNWNSGEGCWEINPPLDDKKRYYLVTEYREKDITVYLNNKFIKKCQLSGTIVPSNDAFIGGGVPVTVSIWID